MRRYRNIAQCKQVTDRFNLMMNLSDCVYDVIRQEYNALANSLIEGSTSEETISPEITVERPGKVPKRGKGEMNDYFKERFEKVKEMQKQRHGFRTIAKTLQMSRNTVRRYADMDVLPKKSIYIKNNYTDFQEIIERDFSEGKCVKRIFESITKAGFKGSLTGFYEYFKNHPMRTVPGTTVQSPTKPQMISPRKISRYLSIADLNKIKDNFDRKTMASLVRKNTLLKKLRHLILSLKKLLLGDDDSSLEDWIEKALAI